MGFFDAFTGKSQSKAISQGYQNSQNYLNTGRTNATGNITSGRDSAMGTLNPWMQNGQRGQTAYYDAMGMNGDAARQAQFGSFQSSPFMQYANQASQNNLNALFKRYNAQGMGNSGTSQLAVSRAAGERAQSDVTDYLNRLQGMGAQGQQAAQYGAGIQYGAGKDLADIEMGYANTSAGNAINYANAQAAAKTQGVNNLLRFGGMLGGAAISALAPGAGGISAAGNVKGGMSSMFGGGGGGSAPAWVNPDTGGGWNGSSYGGGYAPDPRRPWA